MRCSTISRHITWLLIVITLTCLPFSAISCMKNASPSKEMNKKFFKHDTPRRASLPSPNSVSPSSGSDSGLHVQVWSYVMCKATDMYVFVLDNRFFVLGLVVYSALSSYELLSSMALTMLIPRWLLTVPCWLFDLLTFRMTMLSILRSTFARSSPALAYINTWLANPSFGCAFLFLLIESYHPHYFQVLFSKSSFSQICEDMRLLCGLIFSPIFGLLRTLRECLSDAESDFFSDNETHNRPYIQTVDVASESHLGQCFVDLMKLYTIIYGTSILVTVLHLMNVAHPGIDSFALFLTYAISYPFHPFPIYLGPLTLLGILRSSFTPGLYLLIAYSLNNSRALLSDPTSSYYSSSSSNGTRKGTTTLASAAVFSNGSAACALSIGAFLFLF